MMQPSTFDHPTFTDAFFNRLKKALVASSQCETHLDMVLLLRACEVTLHVLLQILAPATANGPVLELERQNDSGAVG